MTRKDFEMFAEAFAQMNFKGNSIREEGAKMTVDVFMDICERINPRFDREKFWDRVMHYTGKRYEK